MTDFKVSDVVYYDGQQSKVLEIQKTKYHDVLVLINGDSVLPEDVLPEKDYLKQRLEEIEAEESDPAWPLPEDTPHYFYDINGSIYEEDEYLRISICNQGLSKRRVKQNFELAKLRQNMCLWVDTFCPDWEPKWSCSKTKWGLNFCADSVEIRKGFNIDVFFCQVSVPKFELAQEMLKEFGQRIEGFYKL